MTTRRDPAGRPDGPAGIVLPSYALERAADQWRECAGGVAALAPRVDGGPPGSERVRVAGERFAAGLADELHTDARTALRASDALLQVAADLAQVEGMARELFDRLWSERAE